MPGRPVLDVVSWPGRFVALNELSPDPMHLVRDTLRRASLTNEHINAWGIKRIKAERDLQSMGSLQVS